MEDGLTPLDQWYVLIKTKESQITQQILAFKEKK